MTPTNRFAFAKTYLLRQHRDRPVVFYAALLLLPALLAVGAVGGLIGLVYAGAFGEIPSRATIALVETPEASWLLDRKGTVLSRYYRENREIATEEELPDLLKRALLATEDERFFEHEGIDWRATARAVFVSGLLGRAEQGGGSTLSQQLAKNHFPRARGGKLTLLAAKVKEAITAQRFESEYTKEELITLYLNSVPFGENIYGVKVAARRFFDVEVADLRAEQGAVLVAMLKANSSYNPAWHPERSLKRRNLVLGRMARQGFLTEAERDSLVQLPLKLSERKDRAQAQASYFSERVKSDIARLLDSLAEADGIVHDLYSGGLRVTTTVDAELQDLAEQAVVGHLQALQPAFRKQWNDESASGFTELLDEAIAGSDRYAVLRASGKSEQAAMTSFGESRTIRFSERAALPAGAYESSWRDSVRAELIRLRAGFVVADAHTEEVLAYVGGSDFAAVPFNGATARRQVGSIFKPVVYAAAVEAGGSPCEYFVNDLRTYTDFEDWTPRNSDGEYGGEYSMTGGLVNSVNTVAVQLAFQVGPKRVSDLAATMGAPGVPAEPSVALGTPSLSLEEMMRVYGTFARGGTVPTYHLVSRIETRGGELLYEAPDRAGAERPEAFSERTGEVMRHMMQQVAERGTGAGLAGRYGVRGDVAGKTGTTQNQADGWFMGFTPELVVGSWVGAAYPNIRWKSLRDGQGARTAMPIVGRFLKDYEAQYGVRQFPELSEDVATEAECEDFLEEGEGLFADEEFGEGGGIESALRSIFTSRKQREAEAAERTRRARRPNPVGAAERNAEREKARKANNDRLAKQRRQGSQQRKRAARKRRKKKAWDGIFGRKPD